MSGCLCLKGDAGRPGRPGPPGGEGETGPKVKLNIKLSSSVSGTPNNVSKPQKQSVYVFNNKGKWEKMNLFFFHRERWVVLDRLAILEKKEML